MSTVKSKEVSGEFIQVVDVKSDAFISDSQFVEDDNPGQIFEHDKALHRGLKQRHVQMLALVGVFGTGLFLSSGATLALVGNVGMLIAYVFVGLIFGLNQMANAETTALMPVAGAMVRQAEHFVDDAFGFALGWINVYSSIIPAELAATAVVMSYWSDLNPAVWITIFSVVIVATNSYTIRFYGEVEFVFGLLKISLILGLFILGLVIDLGGVKGVDRIGFRYWKETPFKAYHQPGSLGKFLAFWKCVSGVVYSFGGIQSISIFGGETQHPRRSIFVAAKRIFYRVFILYFITVFVLTMILSANDPDIASPTGTALGSPFVIAIKRAGIKGLPSVVNAVVLSSAFSAANLSIVQTSRYLFALAAKSQAPKIFLKTNKRGLPIYGVIFSAAFIPLAYMSVSSTSSTVFGWFQNLTSSNLLIGIISVSLNHIFMSRALKAQGYSRDRLPHTFRFAPYAAWISLFFGVLFLLTSGFPNFMHHGFNISSFFSNYFSIPVIFFLYFFWKIIKKTKLKRPEEVDFESLFREIDENPEPPLEKLKGFEYVRLLWS